MENSSSQALYSLKLHEIIEIKESKTPNRTTYVMRVPGGWLYRTTRLTSSSVIMTETFVAYSDEFNAIRRNGK